MKNKLLLASLIFLLGCDPLGRLTGTSTKHEDSTPKFNHSPILSYDGDFRGANFVDVDADGAKEIVVYIKRGKDWVPLDGYDTTQKSKDPYYVLVNNEIIFMNITADDKYSIRITK